MTTHNDTTSGRSADNPDRMWADDHLEAWMGGDLSEQDAARFERILAGDDWLSAEIARFRMIDDAFADMLSEARVVRAPKSVTSGIMAHAWRDWAFQLPRRLMQGFRQMTSAGLRPALAVALLLIVVLSSTWIARTPSSDLIAGTDASQAQVTQALADVKMALAVLADAGQTTGTAVGADVIAPYVVQPMARGMNTVIEN